MPGTGSRSGRCRHRVYWINALQPSTAGSQETPWWYRRHAGPWEHKGKTVPCKAFVLNVTSRRSGNNAGKFHVPHSRMEVPTDGVCIAVNKSTAMAKCFHVTSNSLQHSRSSTGLCRIDDLLLRPNSWLSILSLALHSWVGSPLLFSLPWTEQANFVPGAATVRYPSGCCRAMRDLPPHHRGFLKSNKSVGESMRHRPDWKAVFCWQSNSFLLLLSQNYLLTSFKCRAETTEQQGNFWTARRVTWLLLSPHPYFHSTPHFRVLSYLIYFMLKSLLLVALKYSSVTQIRV